MKRIFVLLSLALVLPLSQPTQAGPALLFEVNSGRIIYGEDFDDQWHPASLTKIMTAYLTFQALKSGKMTLETKIPYSENAALQPPSKIGLQVGAEISVDNALRALVIKSANDIAMALGEAVGGSEAQFVDMMNAMAKRLGMSRTHFVNPNGLPAPEQVTTARDLAILARAISRDFPEYNHYWSLEEMRLGRIRIVTHNGILKSYVGADGMKTGFICDSGYNVVASATRGPVRMIAVVLGENSGRERSVRAQALLEHGFNTYGWKTLLGAGTLDSVKMTEGARDVTSIRASVMATECGNRRRIAHAAKARQHVKARAAKTAAAEGSATGPVAAAPAAAAPATAKSAKSTTSAAATHVAKPKPAVAAPAGGGAAP